MVKSNQADMFKLNKASKHREECEKHERKVKRSRNIMAGVFIISVFLIIMSQLFIKSAGEINAQSLSIETFQLVAYAGVFLGIASLVWLIVTALKSISLNIKVEKARKMEGVLTQHVFRMILINS